MKVLSRDFTLKEKILLLLLGLLLVGLAYYQFVDQPVRQALETAHSEADSLRMELTGVEAKLATMRRMRAEVEDVTSGGAASEMGSYNNSKREIAFLNDILGETLSYDIKFESVTRDGDQIRRNFDLKFKTEGYELMEDVLASLTNCHYRCLIGDLNCSAGKSESVMEGEINASIKATFYETMVGGTPDAGLPQDRAAAK